MNTKRHKPTLESILSDELSCPFCGAHNLTWREMRELSEVTGVDIPSTSYAGATYEVAGYTVTHGTACWDSTFGDTCGACHRTIINLETSAIGPNGFCAMSGGRI